MDSWKNSKDYELFKKLFPERFESFELVTQHNNIEDLWKIQEK